MKRNTMCSSSVRCLAILATLLLYSGTAMVVADEPADTETPKPIPQTRAEMKQALEQLKHRAPRLPFTEPEAAEDADDATQRPVVNNARMRALYLPESFRGRSRPQEGRGRQQVDRMALDRTFTVELFWIASRVNNCHYCLGHQEVKLRAAGVDEQRLAALDLDWSEFTPAERAAYHFARKLTLRPADVTDEDIDQLSKHYQPLEILEIIFVVSRYNATNRWTDSLGIPQETHRELLTETPARLLDAKSIVAPTTISPPQPLPTEAEAVAALEASRERSPRLPLASDAEAEKVMADLNISAPVPHWIRLVSQFPSSGTSAVRSYQQALAEGELAPEIKAQIAWTAARHDQAWYALGHAAQRLGELGYDRQKMFALDHPEQSASPSERAVMELVAKLTTTPQAITDADIANVRKHFSDPEVAEIVYHTTQAAFFHRLTEAANLPLEFQVP